MGYSLTGVTKPFNHASWYLYIEKTALYKGEEMMILV